MKECISTDFAVIASALIGVLGTLLGVLITSIVEYKRRKIEQIEKAKPILINYALNQLTNKDKTPWFSFLADDDSSGSVSGLFKNTSNAILFLDYVKTETKHYYPNDSTTIDRNTEFYIDLQHIGNESLKQCKIFCHDIYNNDYYFQAHFDLDYQRTSNIIIDDSMPKKV